MNRKKTKMTNHEVFIMRLWLRDIRRGMCSLQDVPSEFLTPEFLAAVSPTIARLMTEGRKKENQS